MKYAVAAAVAVAFAATAAYAGGEGRKGADDEAMNAKVEVHFKEVDANADGQVTEAELIDYMTAKAKSEFAEASGGDGVMTLDEAKAHHKAKHEAMMTARHNMDQGEHKSGDH
jgi:hypothetical protein